VLVIDYSKHQVKSILSVLILYIITVKNNMEKINNMEGSPEQLGSSEEETMDSSNCLLVIQQLFADKRIDDDQRDTLKGKCIHCLTNFVDLVFDDDVALLGLF
jgi:hypothetical protein